jgi:hypothetical protein
MALACDGRTIESRELGDAGFDAAVVVDEVPDAATYDSFAVGVAPESPEAGADLDAPPGLPDGGVDASCYEGCDSECSGDPTCVQGCEDDCMGP